MSEIFVYLYVTLRDDKLLLEYLKDLKKLNEIDSQLAYEFCVKLPCNYLTIFDKEFYTIFTDLENAPLVMFYIGNLATLKEDKIFLLSDDKPSDYGLNLVADCMRNTSSKCVVIENKLNKFNEQILISTIVNKKSIILYSDENISKTIRKFSKYIDYILDDGIIVSYVFKKDIVKSNYLKLLHLVNKIVIIETDKRSQINSIASYCASKNIEIFVAPARMYDYKMSGNNLLIADGASILDFSQL